MISRSRRCTRSSAGMALAPCDASTMSFGLARAFGVLFARPCETCVQADWMASVGLRAARCKSAVGAVWGSLSAKIVWRVDPGGGGGDGPPPSPASGLADLRAAKTASHPLGPLTLCRRGMSARRGSWKAKSTRRAKAGHASVARIVDRNSSQSTDATTFRASLQVSVSEGAAIALHGWERGGSGKVEKARTRREHDSTRLWAREMAQRWVVGEYNLVWALLRAAGRCLAGDAGELWNVREPEAGRVGLGEIDVVAPAALEVEARAIRFRKIPVVEYDWEGDHEGPLAVPGSAMVFIAKKGSPVLKEIRAAAKARNGSDAGVARKVFSPFRERRPMAL